MMSYTCSLHGGADQRQAQIAGAAAAARGLLTGTTMTVRSLIKTAPCWASGGLPQEENP